MGSLIIPEIPSVNLSVYTFPFCSYSIDWKVMSHMGAEGGEKAKQILWVGRQEVGSRCLSFVKIPQLTPICFSSSSLKTIAREVSQQEEREAAALWGQGILCWPRQNGSKVKALWFKSLPYQWCIQNEIISNSNQPQNHFNTTPGIPCYLRWGPYWVMAWSQLNLLSSNMRRITTQKYIY